MMLPCFRKTRLEAGWKEAVRNEKGGANNVRHEEGLCSGHDVSNADFPGSSDGWGVCMRLFAPL